MNEQQIQHHLRQTYKSYDIPSDSVNYLRKIKKEYNFTPTVIYDIGACVLHWAQHARFIWPTAGMYLFEAMPDAEFLYKEENYKNYHIGVLSDVDDKEIIFYESTTSPGGNSYYKENSWATNIHYTQESEKHYHTITVDTVIKNKNFPLPDLIKIDVQGAEIDILRGMPLALSTCKHLIVELQHEHYNDGAPLNTESIPIIESLGFKLVTPLFSNNGPDGDYHFIKN